MKKYLLKILLFFAIVVAIDFCFGSICDYMVAHAKGGSNKQMNDLCMNDQYDILVMGSSRTHHHYNPLIIEDSLGLSCYNAGYDGNGIVLADGIYSLVRERYKPKVIVYDLTLGFDCYEYLQDQQNKRYISNLKPYYKHEKVREIVARISNEEYYKLFSGLLRYNSKSVNLAKEYLMFVPMYDHGFAPLRGCMDYEPTNYEEVSSNTPIDPVKMSFLKDFIREVQADSVLLVFAMSPRYKSPSRDKFVEIERLCADYNVPVIDFYNDSLFYLNKEYFEDIAHMNQDGANAYTKVFTSKLSNIVRND